MMPALSTKKGDEHMTPKPKPRKAPEAKASAPKLVKPAASEPSRDVNKIEVLAARFRWLEADQDYQTAIAAPRERDADLRHDAEQKKIIAELRILRPQDYHELAALFRFAIDEIKMGPRCDGGEFDMLQNVYDALPCILRDERKTALQEGMKNMHEFLDKRACRRGSQSVLRLRNKSAGASYDRAA
jgi:hypothetical protein